MLLACGYTFLQLLDATGGLLAGAVLLGVVVGYCLSTLR